MKKARASALVTLLSLACARTPQPAAHDPHRIVSLAPNLTEIVYAVGCGNKLVGADNFSDTPAAAARLPKVGGVEPDVDSLI